MVAKETNHHVTAGLAVWRAA